MKIPSVLFVTRKEILTFWSLLWIILFSFLYITLTLFLLNYRFVTSIIISSYSLQQKLAILLPLFGGIMTAFTPFDSIIFLLNAILVGINIFLIIRSIRGLKQRRGSLRLSIGGATIIGLISTGCSSCGFSVLSIIGLSTSLSFLPFHGLELHLLALILLVFSAFYMLKAIRDGVYCKIK